MNAENKILFDPKEKDKLLMDIYRGRVNEKALPKNLFVATAEKLKKNVYEGYGAKLDQLEKDSRKYKNLIKLEQNIDKFSASKTFQQIKELEALRYNPDGSIKTLDQFKVDAEGIYNRYNKVWQDVEEDAAWKQADSASKWQEFEEDMDVLPYLMFQTIGDDRVREEHAALDGIIRPVDDPFWDVYMPPLDWNCRCEAIQLEQAVPTPAKVLKGLEEPNPMFRENPGKTGRIFSNEHPYFEVPKEYKKERDKNFGLT